MTQDEIIEMAREADFDFNQMSNGLYTVRGNYAQLEAFAKLVAAKATAKEREACAKLCETHGVHPALNVWNGGPDWYKHGKNCAAVIRARGEA